MAITISAEVAACLHSVEHRMDTPSHSAVYTAVSSR